MLGQVLLISVGLHWRRRFLTSSNSGSWICIMNFLPYWVQYTHFVEGAKWCCDGALRKHDIQDVYLTSTPGQSNALNSHKVQIRFVRFTLRLRPPMGTILWPSLHLLHGVLQNWLHGNGSSQFGGPLGSSFRFLDLRLVFACHSSIRLATVGSSSPRKPDSQCACSLGLMGDYKGIWCS